MTVRKNVDLVLENLKAFVGDLNWEIKEETSAVRAFAQVKTVVGERKLSINFEDGEFIYAEMLIAEKFPCQKLSRAEFEKIMICINRINLWYSNTLVAFVDIKEDGTWDACLRGIVTQVTDFSDNNCLKKALEAVFSFMDSVKNSFGASYLEDFIHFFEEN